jgi:hypothetical protein
MSLSDAPPPASGRAGWFPDPLGSDADRYFDGASWTDQIRRSSTTPTGLPKARAWWRPGWRKMTWAIVLWIVLGVASTDNAGHCAREAHPFLSQRACTDAANAGTGIGVALLVFLWFLGFVILSLVWLMTRPKGRDCPVCGEKVKKGRTVCPSCKFDFAAAAGHEPGQTAS